jgi:hypothetical protein
VESGTKRWQHANNLSTVALWTPRRLWKAGQTGNPRRGKLRDASRWAPATLARMSRLPLPAAGLALVVAALALMAAGCGNSGGHRAATAAASTAKSPAPCKLDRAQRRGVAQALADIRHLRRIQAPMRTFSQRGAPNQEVLTGKFLLDLGSAHLPLNMYTRLLHLAKTAVRLCGDCSTGLETAEPVLGTRAHERCG